MFSKYKKDGAENLPAAPAAKPIPGGAPTTKPVQQAHPEAGKAPVATRRSMSKPAAQATPVDKEKKRKARLGEIKLELHKRLLDSLNLSALDKASESDLRAEIVAIAGEALDEMGVVLNREERQSLTSFTR